jgi:hypothetical protein
VAFLLPTFSNKSEDLLAALRLLPSGLFKGFISAALHFLTKI